MKKRKPIQKRSIDTRDAIIRSADRIILESGYPNLTMRGIARGAGVGIASVYDYFDSKEDVMYAALLLRGLQAQRQLEPLVPQWLRASSETALRECFTWLLREGLEHTQFIRAVWTTAPHILDDPQAVRMRDFLVTVLSLLLKSEADVAEHVDDGDMFLLANALIGILLGAGNGIPETTTLEALVGKMVAACFAFLRSRGADL